MTGILSGDLPAGWRRCSSLGCGAPTGHDGEHVPEAVPPVAVAPVERTPGVMGGRVCIAGTQIDVLGLVGYLPEWTPAEIRRDAYPHLSLATIEAALAWAEAHPEEIERDRRAADEAAGLGPEVDVGAELAPTRAARIEAAARELVKAQDAVDAHAAACEAAGCAQSSAPVVHLITAWARLRAALCTCTAHGPDPACVEHGEALRAWQAREVP